MIVTARKRSCGKVRFLHLSVSHSVHRGCTHPGRHPPPRWPLKRTVRILLECILVMESFEGLKRTKLSCYQIRSVTSMLNIWHKFWIHERWMKFEYDSAGTATRVKKDVNIYFCEEIIVILLCVSTKYNFYSVLLHMKYCAFISAIYCNSQYYKLYARTLICEGCRDAEIAVVLSYD